MIIFTAMLFPHKCQPQSGDILVARKATKERHPGLGMWHDEPSAREFSEMSLSAFRTEGAEVGRGSYRDETRVSRAFSVFRPDRRVFLNIPEVLLSGCGYFLRLSMLVLKLVA